MLVSVHLLVAIHVAHWWSTGRTVSPLEPSEAMEFAKHSVVNAGAIFFSLLILSTLLFGRFFCGWGCHVVALQDLSRWLLERVGVRPQPLRSRLLAWVPLAAFVYMFLWPFAYRVWAGVPLGPVRLEPWTSTFWATFPSWLVALFTFFVCGFVAVYFLGAKGFCTYGCPYGGIFGVVDRLAPLRIRVTDACAGCAHCTATCTSNVRVHEEVARFGMVVDSGCMKCLDCVSVCPNDALYVGFGRPGLLAREREGAEARQHRRPALWEELLLGVAFVATLTVFRGLYGVFPFLLSLGFSAVVAYLALQAARLATRPHLSLRGRVLKRGGRLRPVGWSFLTLLALGGAVWSHSAVVRYQQWRGDRAYAATAEARRALVSGERRISPQAERDAVREASARYEAAARWSLLRDPRLTLRRAWSAALRGDAPAFSALSEEVLDRAPGSSILRIEFADYHRQRGRPAEAARLYEEGLRIDPSHAAAAMNLGAIYLSQRRGAEAASSFERAIEAAPELASAHYNLALLRLLGGDVERAIAGFQRAVELDPGYLEARENLAGVLCSVGRFTEGLAHYEAAIAQSGDDPETRLLAARAYLAVDDLAAARRQLAAALELDPDLSEAERMLRLLPSD